MTNTFGNLNVRINFCSYQKNLSGEERKGSAPSETLLWPEWVIIYHVFLFFVVFFVFVVVVTLSDEIGDQEFAKLVL